MEHHRILFVVEAMGGGIFSYIVDLANELSARYDIWIAHGIRPETPKDYKKYFHKNIQLIRIRHFTRSVDLIKDVQALLELWQITREICPDVIHLHSSKAGVVGRIAFWNSQIPLFYTPHGYSFLMKNQKTIVQCMYRMIESVCSHARCTSISCSLGEHKETLKLTKRAIQIDNGVNIKALQKTIDAFTAFRQPEGHPFTVYTLGRICFQKNPSLFNQIAIALPDVQFLWIGDGEMRQVLDAPNITVTGWVEHTQAIQLALSADAFILTSLWEGLPISLLESMYMKKPCIVSDVEGNHDVIHTGSNGFVCRRLEEFLQAIRSIQREFPSEMVDKSYDSICQHYNTEEMARQYEKAYFGTI